MEDIVLRNNDLDNLRLQAQKLGIDSLSLVELFAKEEILLKHKDEATRLKELYNTIQFQLERATSDENAAAYGHSKAELETSFSRLLVGTAIKMISNNKPLSAFADYLITGNFKKQTHFGTVMFCIGPGGIPGDVEVISVSRLAREANQDEVEIIQDMQQRGYLLHHKKVFSTLINKLVEDIRDGLLQLPVSKKKVVDILTPTDTSF